MGDVSATASPVSNLLYLYANEGPWTDPANVGVAGAGTLSNSQCQVTVAASSVSGSFDTLTLNPAISFESSLVGPQHFAVPPKPE